MPRIRTIKPEALQHRKVGRLGDRAFRLWIAMITQADDHGRGVADAGQMRLVAFGYFPDVTEADVRAGLKDVARTGLVDLYEVKGTPYYLIPSWPEHQKISHPAKPLYPAPPPLQSSPETSRGLRFLPGGSKDLSIKEGSEGPEDDGKAPEVAMAPSNGDEPAPDEAKAREARAEFSAMGKTLGDHMTAPGVTVRR